MKKFLFSLFLILLLFFALFYKKRAEDLTEVNSMLVSYISQNPKVSEVFSLSDGAVET